MQNRTKKKGSIIRKAEFIFDSVEQLSAWARKSFVVGHGDSCKISVNFHKGHPSKKVRVWSSKKNTVYQAEVPRIRDDADFIKKNINRHGPGSRFIFKYDENKGMEKLPE
ncbi:MAG: hypothetical protein HOB34_12715 [Nitrospina sp.]|nr:hypothetical protein [Nitrospina sp.]